MNRLKGLNCYLSGPIDFAENLGSGWRDKITPILQKKGIKVPILFKVPTEIVSYVGGFCNR